MKVFLFSLSFFLQKKPSGVSHAIRGATTSSYKVLNTDIGCLIYVSCEPVRVDGMKGSSMVSPHVGPVLPGNEASCQKLCSTTSAE
jgi:hypothetical protein